jgi:enamine deaminase RidA (YjgF/YER057c/UK114 family)
MHETTQPRNPAPIPADALDYLRERAHRSRNLAQLADHYGLPTLGRAFLLDALSDEIRVTELRMQARGAMQAAQARAEAAGRPHRWSDYLSVEDARLLDVMAHLDGASASAGEVAA